MQKLYLRAVFLAAWVAAVALTAAQHAPQARVAYPLITATAHVAEN